MKFPSLIKTNKYGSFHYEPRYYDPVKEEIAGKMKTAKKRAKDGASSESYASNISLAFQQRERKSGQSSMTQMMLATIMLATFVAWLFYGNEVFYAYLLISPVYFYFRLKGKAKKKD